MAVYKFVIESDGKVLRESSLSKTELTLLRQGLFYARVRDSNSKRKEGYRRLMAKLNKYWGGRE